MPATRKITREAQNQDLEQLKGLFGAKAESPSSAKPIETVPLSETQTASEQKTTADTTVGIRMTTQKKREIKAFFIQKGTTLSQGIIDAYNLLKELDTEGIVIYKDGQLIRN